MEIMRQVSHLAAGTSGSSAGPRLHASTCYTCGRAVVLVSVRQNGWAQGEQEQAGAHSKATCLEVGGRAAAYTLRLILREHK